MVTHFFFYSSLQIEKNLMNERMNVYAADVSARERESGQITKIFNQILIPSYNGDVYIVQCSTPTVQYTNSAID